MRGHARKGIAKAIDVAVVTIPAGMLPVVSDPIILPARRGPAFIGHQSDDLQTPAAQSVYNRIIGCIELGGVRRIRPSPEIDPNPTSPALGHPIRDRIG